jgi:hypothetical protein
MRTSAYDEDVKIAPLIEVALGWRDAARALPMIMDTVFALCSMTKTVKQCLPRSEQDRITR